MYVVSGGDVVSTRAVDLPARCRCRKKQVTCMRHSRRLFHPSKTSATGVVKLPVTKHHRRRRTLEGPLSARSSRPGWRVCPLRVLPFPRRSL
jgi:hypothetical protein